ncbi:MAG: hypothetical protein MJA29_09255 [Candidatus Omnitrophica bacterium]|nr:hypothetical protein [Candidatus Omnitrophota bacterium]
MGFAEGNYLMRRAFLFCVFFCILFVPLRAEDGRRRQLIFFHSPSCNHCMEVEEVLIADIEKRLTRSISVERRDVNELKYYSELIGLRDRHGAAGEEKFDLPVIFFDGVMLTGLAEISERLPPLLANISGHVPAGAAEELPAVDLLERFKGFHPLAVASAGLADGINPCAFTVIVFFISFLTLQGYRRRELVCIGSSFITAVFATYLAIGLGLFNFLYELRGFWAVTRTVNLAVGFMSIALGCFALYDIMVFRAGGSTEKMLLQLPRAVKQRIHSVVGHFYRRSPSGKTTPGSGKPSLLKLVTAALATGFTVSLLEAVCTGQLYLPTIVFVLKSGELRLRAFEYLVLYNVLFVVPLIIVFLLSLLGTTSADFARFMRRHMVLTKVIMALIFFMLGVFLLRRRL